MVTTHRLTSGELFPDITLPATDGSQITLGETGWRALFIVRGAHCRVCRSYLGQLEKKRTAWEARGIDLLVASADPVAKSREFMLRAGYHGRAVCELDVPAMQALGIWMTGPDQSELDYVHPEPGFFLIDPDGNVAAAEVATMPAVRPDLEWLDKMLSYIVENDIRPRYGRYEVVA